MAAGHPFHPHGVRDTCEGLTGPEAGLQVCSRRRRTGKETLDDQPRGEICVHPTAAGRALGTVSLASPAAGCGIEQSQ